VALILLTLLQRHSFVAVVAGRQLLVGGFALISWLSVLSLVMFFVLVSGRVLCAQKAGCWIWIACWWPDG
jgi:hypothetical protein